MTALQKRILAGWMAPGLVCLLGSPAPSREPDKDVVIRSQVIRVEIEGRLATTTIEQVYANPRDTAEEITYAFRLPEDGSVHDLAMWVAGARCPAVVYPRATASRIYREIVGNQQDPALLEYLGQGRWNLQVFPIPAKGSQKVEIVCTHLMPTRGGRIVYRTPEVLSCLEHQDSLDFSARVRSAGGVRSLRAETHPMGVQRHADGSVTVGLRADGRKVKPTERFGLSFVPSRPPAEPATWKTQDGKARFWAWRASLDDLVRNLRRRRDVGLVLDLSASMDFDKLALLKLAAERILTGLSERDRFAVVLARGDAAVWRDELTPATERNVARALGYVRSLRCGGGTDLAAALRAAETFNRDPKTPFYLVVLSDGDDLVGARGLSQVDELLAQPSNATPPAENVQAFWLCIGANDGFQPPRLPTRRGRAKHADYAEDAEEFAREFLKESAGCVIENARAAVTAPKEMSLAEVHTSQPRRGALLRVCGAYARGGEATVTLTATVDGRRMSRAFPLVLPDPAEAPRASAWATERLAKLRAHLECEAIWGRLEADPADPAPLERMVAVSIRHRIVTRATAFLILETEEDYVGRGIRPPGAQLAAGQEIHAGAADNDAAQPDSPPSPAAAEIAYWRGQARRARGAGRFLDAARALKRVQQLDPGKFDAGLSAAILQEFAALRESVRLERGGALPTDLVCKGTWHEMLQPVGVVSTVPSSEPLGTAPGPKAPAQPLGDPDVLARLRRRIPELACDGRKLEDCVRLLGKLAGLDIRARWNPLGVCGVDRDTPVDVRARNVTVEQALQLVMDDLHDGRLDYTIDGKTLWITTADDTSRRTPLLVYDLRDLLYRPPPRRGLLPAHRHDLPPYEAGRRGADWDIYGEEADPGLRLDPTGPEGLRVGTIRQKEPPVAENWSPMPRLSSANPTDTVAVRNFRGPGVELSALPPRSRFGGEGGFFDDDEHDEREYPPGSRAAGVRDLIRLLRSVVDPVSCTENGGAVRYIREFRGLFVIRHTFTNHRRIARFLEQLRAFNPTVPYSLPHPARAPEALFSAEAGLQPWVLELLRRARAGTLSRFSSVRVRGAAGRTFARIGGIWFDTALTARSSVLLVEAPSPAAGALLSAAPELAACFALGRSVIVALDATRAVCLDHVGIDNPASPAFRKLLGAMKK